MGTGENNGPMVLHCYESHPQDSRIKEITDGVMPTVSSKFQKGTADTPMVLCYRKTAHPRTADEGQGWEETDKADTLNVFDNSETRTPTAVVLKAQPPRKYIIRRLTPLECERLQGFPDGWTAITRKNKPMPDSARYRMLGNSIAVPCAEYIFGRIKNV